ncbi:MAG: ATP-binding protein [Candidatus Bathyarchaeia archaeon]
MMSGTDALGSVLGQGRRDDEVLVASSIEKAGTLRKGTIIAHDALKETILMQVAGKITWADISEQDLYLMSENERLAYQIIQRSPKSYILRCVIVGAISGGEGGLEIHSGTTSFIADKSPEVRTLNQEERRMIYGRGGLSVGVAVDGSTVTLPINGLLQRHLSVIGMTGCGKSFLLGLLCEELAKHKAAIIIIDPHNEYIPMAQSMPKEVGRMLYSLGTAVGLNTYTLDVKEISAFDFQHFTGMGEGSTSILENVIRTLKRTSPEYTIHDILGALDSIAQSGSASEAMAATWARNYIRNLAETGFIGTREPPIKEIVRVNQISVVAMSGVKERIQQFVVTSILQRIFVARRRGEIPPVVLVVEEAHRFAPSGESASSSAIMRTLAAEGRKFGICLVVVSQRPNRLDSTVLSQCVTNMVMKVKNPVDLASIRESAENVTDDVIEELPKFERGEALIMGEAFPVSIRFKVRSDRKTKHGGKSVDFEGLWLEEHEKGEVKRFEFPDEL